MLVTPPLSDIRMTERGPNPYPDLRTAIWAAADGARITRGPGVYKLDNPVVIKKSIELVGTGKDETRIIGDGDQFLMVLESGSLRMEGLRLEHMGNLPRLVRDG